MRLQCSSLGPQRFLRRHMDRSTCENALNLLIFRADKRIKYSILNVVSRGNKWVSRMIFIFALLLSPYSKYQN